MLEKNDFVEIDYTGRLVKNGKIFDTTNKDSAIKENIHNPKMSYEPITICLGQNQILPGLDKEIIGLKENDEKEVNLEAKDAFGKKNPKLIMLIPISKFKKENLRPVPGMQINVDNQLATIKTVNGGRVMADFNHPLAGNDVIYNIKIIKKINDTNKKAQAQLSMMLNHKIETEFSNETLKVKLNLPKEYTKPIEDKLKELIPEIKTIEFSAEDKIKEKV